MSTNNVIEFPAKPAGLNAQVVTSVGVPDDPFIFDNEGAAVDRARESATYLAGVALARSSNHVGSAIALLADAIAELYEIALKFKTDRILGPGYGPGGDAA
jgi:hypothetical protein